MSNDKDFQRLIERLIEAGIIKSADDLAQEAVAMLKSLTDDEIDGMFSMRLKLSDEGRKKFHHCLPIFGF